MKRQAGLEWTPKLGDAFVGQEKQVMETIQKLRKKAEEQGDLKTTKEQRVIVRDSISAKIRSNLEVLKR